MRRWARDAGVYRGVILALCLVLSSATWGSAKVITHYFTGTIDAPGTLPSPDGEVEIPAGTYFAGSFSYDTELRSQTETAKVGHYAAEPAEGNIFTVAFMTAEGTLNISADQSGAFEVIVDAETRNTHSLWLWYATEDDRDIALRFEDEETQALLDGQLPTTLFIEDWTSAVIEFAYELTGKIETLSDFDSPPSPPDRFTRIPLLTTRNPQLTWEAPRTNDDDTPLRDLAGYTVFCGRNASNYTRAFDVGLQPSITLRHLRPGKTYFCAVVAYDMNGNTSDFTDPLRLWSGV